MDQRVINPSAKSQEEAVLYLRVSTEEQVENYSLETQLDICTKEAQKRGFSVGKIFREEGRSAKTIKGRPALLEMLDYCRKNRKSVRAVIVYRLDRISRQTADYLAIRKKLSEYEMVLISASEPTGNSPTEKFVETMLAGFAQMDNDVRSERTKNGLRARFLAGLCNGPVPTGYLNQSGYAIKDPTTFEVVKEAWTLMATGTKTLQDMADYLNEKGLKSGHGGKKRYPFRMQTVSRIFHNKFYAGKIVSPKWGEEVLGQHTPMITEAQFYRVQEVLGGRASTADRTVVGKWSRDNDEFTLRRIVKCTWCGRSYTGAKSKGRSELYPYYFCPNRCKPSRKVPAMDEYTGEYLEKITPTKETIDLFNAFLRRTYFQRITDLKKRQEQADDELKKLYELRQGLVEKHLMGIYSDEMFKEQNLIIEQKIKSIHIAKNAGLLTQYNIDAVTAFIENKIGHLKETFSDPGASLNEKRTLLGSIFPFGLPFDGKQYSNPNIDSSYSLIRSFKSGQVSFGSANGIRTRDLQNENLMSWTN
jgi:site-specific DNA recombinase